MGDPIEVGALGQGLSDRTRPDRIPVALISNKSCYGHTEGAAGLTGVLLAAASLQSTSLSPIMHLRNLNPHVGAALGDWKRSAGVLATVPLQPAGENTLLTCQYSSAPLQNSR